MTEDTRPAAAWPVMPLAEAHARLTAPGSPFETEELIIDGIRRRVWRHAPRSARMLVDRALAFGDAPFLVLGDVCVTFSAFHRAVAALADWLLSIGVGKGDRVAIAMRNLPEWPVTFFAATVVGAIATPLNAWWTRDELLFGLQDSGATIAFVDDERLARLEGAVACCPVLRHLVPCELPAGTHLRSLHDIIGLPQRWGDLPPLDLPGADLDPDDAATIFYTSGTTGEPKGALATHRNILSAITGAAFAGARAALRRGDPPAPAGAVAPRGTLMVIPFFHVTGCFAVLSPALYTGNKVVLMRRWDAEQAMALIEAERLSWVVGVPAIAWEIALHPATPSYDLSSLLSLGHGGAPAAPELARRLADVLPHAVPGHGWGMTETSGLATTHAAEDYHHRPASCGAPVAVVDIRIVSEDERTEMPIGAVGEVWVSGPNVVKGYWRRQEATRATFVDGWVRTGDLGHVDDEGFLYIVDRKKDMLIRGGENIHCIEIENCLHEHPAVADAAVVGMPHAILGEVPGAVVRTVPGADITTEMLRRHVADRLAAYKVPAAFLIGDAPLPRNPAGKLLKREIAARLATALSGTEPDRGGARVEVVDNAG